MSWVTLYRRLRRFTKGKRLGRKWFDPILVRLVLDFIWEQCDIHWKEYLEVKTVSCRGNIIFDGQLCVQKINVWCGKCVPTAVMQNLLQFAMHRIKKTIAMKLLENNEAKLLRTKLDIIPGEPFLNNRSCFQKGRWNSLRCCFCELIISPLSPPGQGKGLKPGICHQLLEPKTSVLYPHKSLL